MAANPAIRRIQKLIANYPKVNKKIQLVLAGFFMTLDSLLALQEDGLKYYLAPASTRRRLRRREVGGRRVEVRIILEKVIGDLRRFFSELEEKFEILLNIAGNAADNITN